MLVELEQVGNHQTGTYRPVEIRIIVLGKSRRPFIARCGVDVCPSVKAERKGTVHCLLLLPFTLLKSAHEAFGIGKRTHVLELELRSLGVHA